MRTKTGRVVQTPGSAMPYKVVLQDEGGSSEDHPVATIREGEALMRGWLAPPTPEPPQRVRLPDWNL
jgi:hypothetical protein